MLTVSEQAELQTSKYSNVAGLTILIFDYVITLGDEAQWIWGRSWGLTRIIFTTSRYLPFVGAVMTAYTALRTGSEPCGARVEESIIHTLGIVAAEILLILRTYAFWQGDKRVLFGLLGYGAVTLGASIAINVTQTQLIPIDGGHTPSSCILMSSRNNTFIDLVLLAFEVVILLLTAYKWFYSYRKVNTTIVHTIYRDGMFYLACIMLVTFANLLINAIFPPEFSDLLDITQISLHSILASRIMFNLRKNSCQFQSGETMDQGIFSDIIYHMPFSDVHSTDISSCGSRCAKTDSGEVGVELVELERSQDCHIPSKV